MEELSKIKIEQLNKQPILETQITLSEDKKWVIHRTVITDIKPVSYLQKVLTKKEMHRLIDNLPLKQSDKFKLKIHQLKNYSGLAEKLADLAIKD